MERRELEQVEQTLLELVRATGRDDVGVSGVVEEDGQVRFTLTKGTFSHTDVLPAAILRDPLQARQRVNLIVTRLSKQVERAHLEEAGRGS